MSSTKSVLITGDESGTGLEMAVFFEVADQNRLFN